MKLKLIEPTFEMEEEYNHYIGEWEDTEEKVIPYASGRNHDDYRSLLALWQIQKTDRAREQGLVPSSLYFLTDEKGRIYGALHIRNELNDYLLNYGGHIGYGIRPSERGKGYATTMLMLALPIAKELGIKKILMVCNKNNVASAKTITNNGGVLENEVIVDGETMQRYWIGV